MLLVFDLVFDVSHRFFDVLEQAADVFQVQPLEPVFEPLYLFLDLCETVLFILDLVLDVVHGFFDVPEQAADVLQVHPLELILDLLYFFLDLGQTELPALQLILDVIHCVGDAFDDLLDLVKVIVFICVFERERVFEYVLCGPDCFFYGSYFIFDLFQTETRVVQFGLNMLYSILDGFQHASKFLRVYVTQDILKISHTFGNLLESKTRIGHSSLNYGHLRLDLAQAGPRVVEFGLDSPELLLQDLDETCANAVAHPTVTSLLSTSVT